MTNQLRNRAIKGLGCFVACLILYVLADLATSASSMDFQRITAGMSSDEVEAILGKPYPTNDPTYLGDWEKGGPTWYLSDGKAKVHYYDGYVKEKELVKLGRCQMLWARFWGRFF